MLEVNRHICIPLREFRFDFSRSSGAGGQNVNKLNTKVTLHWKVHRSSNLPADVRERFCARFHHRVNSNGELVLTSQRFRDQGRNVADCLEKLRRMLEDVARPPRPRKPTRPHRGAVERRLATKHRTARRKKERSTIPREDE